jgi:hypothetical protein
MQGRTSVSALVNAQTQYGITGDRSMPSQDFVLQPFPAAPHPPVALTGALTLSGPTLVIRYALSGPLNLLALPSAAARPARRQALWEETCFELFLAPRDRPEYWEFNLAPAGHWNVFHFDSYRQGMAAEPAWAALPLAVERRPQSLLLALELDLSLIISPGTPLEAAVAAVIKSADGGLSYWALTHNGPRPDFHRRDSFTLRH